MITTHELGVHGHPLGNGCGELGASPTQTFCSVLPESEGACVLKLKPASWGFLLRDGKKQTTVTVPEPVVDLLTSSRGCP